MEFTFKDLERIVITTLLVAEGFSPDQTDKVWTMLQEKAEKEHCRDCVKECQICAKCFVEGIKSIVLVINNWWAKPQWHGNDLDDCLEVVQDIRGTF